MAIQFCQPKARKMLKGKIDFLRNIPDMFAFTYNKIQVREINDCVSYLNCLTICKKRGKYADN